MLAAFMFAAGVGPKDATSNISAWLNVIGFENAAEATRTFVVSPSLIWACAFLIAFTFIPNVLRALPERKPEASPAHALIASPRFPVPDQPVDDLMPDIKVGELIERLMELKGQRLDESPESMVLAREIGQEIADQVALRGLSMWMRTTGALEKVSHRIAKTGFGVGRDASGKIACLKTYPTGPDSKRNVSDIRFNLQEIRKVWPDV